MFYALDILRIELNTISHFYDEGKISGGQYKTWTADYGLRTGYKIRTRYKMRTGKYGLGIKHGQGIKRGLRTADWV